MSCPSPEVLFLVLGEELIGIDFERLQRQPLWTHRAPGPNVAPIHSRKSLLDLFKDRKEVVVGWTHVTLGSNVYLLGGERLKLGARAHRGYVLEHPQCYIGFAPKAFSLTCKNNTFIVTRSTSMDLRFGKCSPIVANIGPKIYVLDGPPCLNCHHNHEGSFEVYDPNGKYWANLPDPPPYKRDPEEQILGHFVLGHRLFIETESRQAYCFDTKTQNGWQPLAPEVLWSFRQAGLSLPINGISVPFFLQFSNDHHQLVLYRPALEDAYAMVIYAPTGLLVFYQSLREVFHGRHPVKENGDPMPLSGGKNFFFLLPHDRICAMWVASDEYKRLRLFITIFTLELCFNPVVGASSSSAPSQHDEETTFFKPRITHTYDCIVRQDAATSLDQNHVFDAFLCEKVNRLSLRHLWG